MLIVSAISISCKKKDIEPVPSPTPQPTPDMKTNKPFEYRLLKMQNSYEISHSKDFPAYAIRRMNLGVVGGEDPAIPVFEIGELLYDIGDQISTDHHFQAINNDLVTIQNQISALSAEMQQLATQLTIDVDDIMNQMNTLSSEIYVTNIKTAWSEGEPFENLRDFSNAASNFEKDPNNPDNIANMNQARAGINHYAVDECLNTSSSYYMPLSINGLNDLLMGSTHPMRIFVKTILDNVNKSNVQINDYSQALQAYGLLESYFLSYITYQTQALIININAEMVKDSSGVTAKEYIHDQYAPIITEEVTEFFRCVDILYKNLNDYRLSIQNGVFQLDRFNHDMSYLNYGIAPDGIWINALARAQFVSNLLFEGLGLPYPVMCGYILTPWNYTNGHSPIVNQLTLAFDNGHSGIKLNASQDSSRIPYTYWTVGNDNATCTPDNVWYTYRLGTLNQPDPGWAANEEIGITIQDNGYYTPWAHAVPIKGSVKTMYYNPRDPSETSTTYTSECNIQFGYFSVSWPWGYMYLSDFQHSNWHSDLVSIWHYLGPSKKSYAPTSPFFCCYSTETNNGYLYNYIPKYSYPSDYFGRVDLSYSGSLSAQSYAALGDQRYCNVQAEFKTNYLPNSELQGWGGYSVIYNTNYAYITNTQQSIYISIGTQRVADVKAPNGQSYYAYWDIWYGNWQSGPQNNWVTESGFGTPGIPAKSTPCMSTILTCDNVLGTWTGNYSTVFKYQYVYTGFWNIGK